jgi:hypothetical protein
MGRKRKLNDGDEDESAEVDLPPKHLSVAHMRKEDKRLIVVLENAQLETAKVKLNSSLVTTAKLLIYFRLLHCIFLLFAGRQRIRVVELR